MFQTKDYTTMTSEELFQLIDPELKFAVAERLYKKYGYEAKNSQTNILRNATEA